MEEQMSKEIWVTCPKCAKHYNISHLFYTPKFKDVMLHCPWCAHKFAKEESPKTW